MDYHFAHLCAVIAAGLGMHKQDKTSFTIDDFYPPFPYLQKAVPTPAPVPRKPQSPEEIEMHVMNWIRAANVAFQERRTKGH